MRKNFHKSNKKSQLKIKLNIGYAYNMLKRNKYTKIYAWYDSLNCCLDAHKFYSFCRALHFPCKHCIYLQSRNKNCLREGRDQKTNHHLYTWNYHKSVNIYIKTKLCLSLYLLICLISSIWFSFSGVKLTPYHLPQTLQINLYMELLTVSSTRNRVIVVVDANRNKENVDALEWAINHVVRPRDIVLFLGVLRDFGKRNYSCFPLMSNISIFGVRKFLRYFFQ